MSDTHAETLREKAFSVLREHGPMKARKLASILGLEDARGLSMALQWDSDKQRFVNRGGKWELRFK